MALCSLTLHADPQLHDFAFYYGTSPPVGELHAYDVVVVDPKSNIDPKAFNNTDSEVFSYVSVGETNPDRSYAKKLDPKWVIGTNKTFNTAIMDQASPEWRKFFISEVIKPLHDRGFHGFFLDTLDSYVLAAKSKEARAKQVAGLETLIREIKQQFPDTKLIFNRGFELLPNLHEEVYAVAAESLYASYDHNTKRFTDVPPAQRKRLGNILNSVKKYGLPIIVIDYVAPEQRSKARKVANKIREDGFIPWITNGSLTSMGVSSIEVIPRRILILYDSEETEDLTLTRAFQYAAMPLEYYGYVPEFRDVKKPLPQEDLKGLYHGVLLWLTSDDVHANPKLQPWLVKQMRQKIPIVFLDYFGFPLENNLLKPFGLEMEPVASVKMPLKLTKQTKMFGFEMPPHPPNQFAFQPLKTKKGDVILQIKDSAGVIYDMAALTSWGGYARFPNVLTYLPNEEARWILDPMKFLPKALKLKAIPIPDTTTENGKRIMISHVDGDGFPSRAEWLESEYAGSVMKKKIFEKYEIPITVSIIQGEIASDGLYPDSSAQLEEIAQSIFRLPWVEIASHSFSHPFDWQKVDENRSGEQGYHLPIPKYVFNLKKEITGSVRYIDKNLAPKNKKVKVFLWTGESNPTENALALVYKDGLLNMNGGNTTITKSKPSLTKVSPLGVFRNGYFQVYAPIQNENLYTNLWQGPFYGYRRVIETFKLTEKPWRLKPIDIYYHFYSATKLASLKTLDKVYSWALDQDVMNIFSSEYIEKAMDFNDVSISEDRGGWLVRTNGHLKQLRIPNSFGYPDLERSKNIIGYKKHGDNYYLHMGPLASSLIYFTPSESTLPYIQSANGKITSFLRTESKITFGLKAYLPLRFTLGNMRGCRLMDGERVVPADEEKNGFVYSLAALSKDALTIDCS